MNIRMTPIVAIAMALTLAACQEEEVPEATDEGAAGIEESEDPESDSTGTGSAVTEQPADQGESVATVESSESADVEAETADTGEASQEATNSATDAAVEGENPTTAADAPATDAAAEEGVVGAEADSGGTLDEVLTPDGFEADRVLAAIDESDLDEAQKESLREITRAAQEDPSQIDAALVVLREELLGEDGADAGDVSDPERDFAAAPGSLFTPEQFGTSSDYTIEGARLVGMSTAIFDDERQSAKD